MNGTGLMLLLLVVLFGGWGWVRAVGWRSRFNRLAAICDVEEPTRALLARNDVTVERRWSYLYGGEKGYVSVATIGCHVSGEGTTLLAALAACAENQRRAEAILQAEAESRSNLLREV